MKARLTPSLGLLLLTVGACSPESGSVQALRNVDAPAGAGSGESNLTAGADGKVYLSWIEPAGDDRHELRFSVWQGDGWSPARTIALGERWFVNWADFPAMAALKDGTLAANWLVRSADSPYAYDVHLAVSRDGGDGWTEPVLAHRDGTPTEHGFVSLVPTAAGVFRMIWLDGRETAGHESDRGAMTLRAATLDREGRVSAERLLDPRVCDCCQTDAAQTATGSVVVVYRDRSEDEIRDISVTRLEGERWSTPAGVHADNWRMPACPVNGPAVAASGQEVIVAWFTVGERQQGMVQVAFSGNDGRSFGDPIRIGGDQAMGRVDLVAFDDGSALVSWLEQSEVRVQRVDRSGGIAPPRVIATPSDQRASGFPRMAHRDGTVFITWTEPGNPSHVRTALISNADL